MLKTGAPQKGASSFLFFNNLEIFVETVRLLRTPSWVPKAEELLPGDVVYIRHNFDLVHKRTVKEVKHHYDDGRYWLEMEERCGCLSTELIHKDRLQEYFEQNKAKVLKAYKDERERCLARISKKIQEVEASKFPQIQEYIND